MPNLFNNWPEPDVDGTVGLGALHVCPECCSKLVTVTEYRELAERWLLERRCPECEWISLGIFDQEAVECLADELDRGTAALEDELRLVTLENMAEFVDRFAFALASNAILPEDF